MVFALLAPAVGWIWWYHTAQGVGRLAHVCSKAAVNFSLIR
jgi:hypothetical protein